MLGQEIHFKAESLEADQGANLDEIDDGLAGVKAQLNTLGGYIDSAEDD